MEFEVKPLAGGVGVEIEGLDLSRELSEATQRDLYAAWLSAGLLVFRGVANCAERHIALSRCFGTLEVHPVETIRLQGSPEIIRLRNRGQGDAIVHVFGGEEVAGRIPWHTDMIYTDTPCRGALLRMIEKPAVGGQTQWLDTAAAYAALPEATQARIDGLDAEFLFIADICEMRFGRPAKLGHVDMGETEYPEFPPVLHPLVWRHPETGRKALNLSPLNLRRVIGLDRDEGDRLLDELVAHVQDERFAYVHEWQEDDIVLWDNWRTMHSALGTPPQCRREVQRTTLEGRWQTGRIQPASSG